MKVRPPPASASASDRALLALFLRYDRRRGVLLRLLWPRGAGAAAAEAKGDGWRGLGLRPLDVLLRRSPARPHRMPINITNLR